MSLTLSAALRTLAAAARRMPPGAPVLDADGSGIIALAAQAAGPRPAVFACAAGARAAPGLTLADALDSLRLAQRVLNGDAPVTFADGSPATSLLALSSCVLVVGRAGVPREISGAGLSWTLAASPKVGISGNRSGSRREGVEQEPPERLG